MFLLLSFLVLAGIMAEEEVVTHYQVKNSSLCLHVTNQLPNISGSWTFDKTLIVSDKHVNPHYKDKVDFYPLNLTLCIKELTDTDTGVYKVTFHDPKFREVIETQKVVVQDAVPRPVAVTTVLHSNQSAGLCHLEVNCSVQADWAWSVCDRDSCTTPRSSLDEVNITISCDNGTVICSGNNRVSANNVSVSMATMCFNDPEHREASKPIIAIAIVLAVCLSLSAFTACVVKRLHSEYREDQPQAEPRVSTSSSSASEVAYENVDEAQQEVDTVYSVLQAVTSVTPGLGNVAGGVKEHKTVGEASSAQCVAADEASQVNTLYSVLQKPSLRPQRHQQVKGDES